MRILIIHCAYQYKGGEDTVVAEEAQLLQQAGHDVQLLKFSNEGKAVMKILQLPFNVPSYLKATKAIKKFTPDVIHLHNLHFAASPSVLYAIKNREIPFVCTLHNYRLLCPSATLFYKGQAFLNSLTQTFPWTAVRLGIYKNSRLLTFWMALSMQIHYWLGTWNLPNRFIVLSAHAKKIFLASKLDLQDEQIVIKPNFCSPPQLSDIKRSEEFLFVGRLTEEKGVKMLLQLFSSIPHRITLAGDGPLKEEVISYSGKYPNINYVGSLQKQELSHLMQRSTALVFPSIWYEGMPLTIIEAFSCGLPVIATRLGAMEHMVTPGYDGLLFDAGNKTELSQILDQWVSMPAESKAKFSINAQSTYKQSYTPEKNVEQLLAIYQSVIAKQEQPSLALAG